VLRQAVILVGGLSARYDTRLGDPTAPNIGGRPFLEMLIDEVARYDVFEEVLLLASSMDEAIRGRHAGTTRGRARLSVALEQEPLGTAGALARAATLMQDKFLLLQVGSFFDFNLLDLVSRAGSQPGSHGTARRNCR
jgi:NDP-sugar pyrophosphorylase family protein